MSGSSRLDDIAGKLGAVTGYLKDLVKNVFEETAKEYFRVLPEIVSRLPPEEQSIEKLTKELLNVGIEKKHSSNGIRKRFIVGGMEYE